MSETLPPPAERTVYALPAQYGPALWWPSPQPTSDLDYGLDVSALLLASSDSVAVAQLEIAPSGSGELQAIDLGLIGEVIVAQLTGGVQGRTYTIEITVTGASGRVWASVVYLLVDASAAQPPPPWWVPPPAPSPGFGTPITYTAGGVTVFGPALAAVATGLVGTGTNQATALLLTAQTNIIASAPVGTGFILPGTVASGTIVAQNQDGSHAATMYPPLGGQINALGVNAAYSIPAGGHRINFSTQSPGTQWFAG